MNDKHILLGNSFSTLRTKANQRNQRRRWWTVVIVVICGSLVLSWKVIGITT